MSVSVKTSPRNLKEKAFELVIQRHTNKILKGLNPDIQLKHGSLGAKLSSKNSKMNYKDDQRLLFKKNKYDPTSFWVSSPDVTFDKKRENEEENFEPIRKHETSMFEPFLDKKFLERRKILS